ncbi:MAG: glycosyltransferase [Clostridia bacterium]|nr:glycosyltransferase [Clostridia bacterium]
MKIRIGKGNRPQKSSGKIEDVLLHTRSDRRSLSHVPDPAGIRKRIDRRGNMEDVPTEDTLLKERVVETGTRHIAQYDVTAIVTDETGSRRQFSCKSEDISTTGILLLLANEADADVFERAKNVSLRFTIAPGTMPEGYEMSVSIDARYARRSTRPSGEICVGMSFKETLAQYADRRKNNNMVLVSTVSMIFIVLMVVLMRMESIIYFQFNRILYTYSIVAALFLLTRYIFGAMYRPVPINPDFAPGVTIIIPCFNEEEWIERTITSCMNQDYPPERLEVIVVDDCSTDGSVKKIRQTIHKLSVEGERFGVGDRLHYVVQPHNMGKRDAMARGTRLAKHDYVVFVDSDSFLNPFAIRALVQPFQDPKMGGVSGRTDVANTYTNGLTRIQSVRYYIAFRIFKAAEARFDAVTCLSGPLSCYKKAIVLENIDAWLNQRFLGQKATFGDDRAMTNFVLRHHRTSYQDTAVCSTIVPNEHKAFLKQQMRWKRSWLRESMLAGSFMWRKEPFMSFSFYVGMLVPIAAPVVVLYNLIYVPIVHGVFPTTFILGLLAMAMLMSFAQMLLRKSSTWLYGLVFCFYYEAVLLWQMPIAWFTFWKSTWGTRMTEADVQAASYAERRRLKREQREKERELLDA